MGFWQDLPIHSVNTYWVPVTRSSPRNATWVRHDRCPPGPQRPAEGETHMCVNNCSSLGKSVIEACKHEPSEYEGEDLNSPRTWKFSPRQWYLHWPLNREGTFGWLITRKKSIPSWGWGQRREHEWHIWAVFCVLGDGLWMLCNLEFGFDLKGAKEPA